MPNWCCTSMVWTGDKEEIADLYERMQRLENMSEPLVPNGFGTRWLGNLVADLGKDWKDVGCRGTWSFLELLDENTLKFNTETAWYRCTEVDDLIMKKYPSIDITFQCVEGGMVIYETNDEEGRYFPERYMIDVEDSDTQYFDLKEDALDFLEEFFGIDFKNMSEALEVTEEYDNNEANDCNRIWIHEFEIV